MQKAVDNRNHILLSKSIRYIALSPPLLIPFQSHTIKNIILFLFQKKCDLIYMLRKKNTQNPNIEFKEEQRDFLRSSKGFDRCSSLDFTNINSSIDTSIDRLACIIIEAYLESIQREQRKSHN